jgi:DNA gyrase/topoisomerase IV subunit A
MSDLDRPDLTGLTPAQQAYLESLEQELARLRAGAAAAREAHVADEVEPNEPPTTLNVVTASARGFAKRTPRHLYSRQGRGGMGVFDLEAPDGDAPAFLTVVDESHDLLLVTSLARAFRLPVSRLVATPVRGRGQPLLTGLPLQDGETLKALLPAGRGMAVALLTETGYARVLPAHVVGPTMAPGTVLFRAAEFGPISAACWTPGGGDLFIATEHGFAIRFPERALPLAGGPGIRLEEGDRAIAIEAVYPPDGESIFLLGSDGRGTIRLMSGFAANKSAGGGGKIALKTDQLACAVAATPGDDLFVLSRLSKIIRFRASEVPPKEGVVAGVNCMALRADECLAVAASPTQPEAAE